MKRIFATVDTRIDLFQSLLIPLSCAVSSVVYAPAKVIYAMARTDNRMDMELVCTRKN